MAANHFLPQFPFYMSANLDVFEEALEAVKPCAEKDENLVPPVFEAVKAYVTVDEISDLLREVYGEYVEGKSF